MSHLGETMSQNWAYIIVFAEFSFRINLSPYCNTNRPRMKYRGWVYDFDFIFTGKVFDYMPEGFSLTIVELEYDFVHERLLSTPGTVPVLSKLKK